MDDWAHWLQLLEGHVDEVPLLVAAAAFPVGTFEEEPAHIGSSLGRHEVGGVERVLDLGVQADVIERQGVGTGGDLHNGSQERHRIEETCDPKHGWSLAIFRPVCQLLTAQLEISEPLAKHLVRRIGCFRPSPRDLVKCERLGEVLHRVSDVEITFKSLVEVGEGFLHLAHERVHALTLLESHDDVGMHLLDFALDLKHVVVWWERTEVQCDLLSNLVLGVSTATTTATGRDQDGVHDCFTEIGQVVDFSVSMESEK